MRVTSPLGSARNPTPHWLILHHQDVQGSCNYRLVYPKLLGISPGLVHGTAYRTYAEMPRMRSTPLVACTSLCPSRVSSREEISSDIKSLMRER